MSSILEEFACGNVNPEPRFYKHDSSYGKAMRVLTDCEEKLMSLLNDNEKDLLQKFTEAQADVSFLSGIDRFIYGYRLGVLMTIEVFNGKDSLIVGDKTADIQ